MSNKMLVDIVITKLKWQPITVVYGKEGDEWKATWIRGDIEIVERGKKKQKVKEAVCNRILQELLPSEERHD